MAISLSFLPADDVNLSQDDLHSSVSSWWRILQASISSLARWSIYKIWRKLVKLDCTCRGYFANFLECALDSKKKTFFRNNLNINLGQHRLSKANTALLCHRSRIYMWPSVTTISHSKAVKTASFQVKAESLKAHVLHLTDKGFYGITSKLMMTDAVYFNDVQSTAYFGSDKASYIKEQHN